MANININFNFNLPVLFLREGMDFIAYSPAIDLSTAGETFEDAQKNFEEASQAFFEEMISQGTLEKGLKELGWQKNDDHYTPPVLIGQETQKIRVSAVN